jgi:hypothetical protein
LYLPLNFLSEKKVFKTVKNVNGERRHNIIRPDFQEIFVGNKISFCFAPEKTKKVIFPPILKLKIDLKTPRSWKMSKKKKVFFFFSGVKRK